MDSHRLHPVVVLQPGQPLCLRAIGSRRLTVRDGRLWLTQSGSPVDHFLSAGQTLVVDAGRRPVVESDTVEAASLTLQPVGPAASLASRLAAVAEILVGGLKRAQQAHRERRRAALERRLVEGLDEHQLRDIGAPPALLAAARATAALRQQWAEQALPFEHQELPWRG